MATINGILNLYKPVGMTSHDVVGRVRRILREKRVGHAGTLDPAAHGVLPVCVGQATRVVEYLSDAHKTYCARLLLGITTDTYDREGIITGIRPVPEYSLAELETAVAGLRGPIMQLPPIYSAIKVGGQPLYKAARAGTAGEIELKARPVEIFRLEVTEWQPPYLQIWIECSKGTYIRALAYDLGERLGCGAFMHNLVRVQSGPFHIAQSVSLAGLEASLADGQLEQAVLQPVDSVLGQWPAWIVDDIAAERIRQGRNLSLDYQGWQLNSTPDPHNSDFPLRRAYTASGQLLALLEREGAEWHPAKVFK